MALIFDKALANSSLPFVTAATNLTNVNTLGMENRTFPVGCMQAVSKERDFLPWDNPDNIVSAEVETIASRLMNIMLALLFFIGGPGNVINMAVFYKQGLKDRVNLCLFALSLTDELYLIMAMCVHAEQVHMQFTSTEKYGPMFTFIANNNLLGFLGLLYVSLVLSAIIATERCVCILNPLKFQTLMRTKTMLIIIIVVYLVVIGLHFIVSFRFYIGCVYDPVSDVVFNTLIIGEFYKKHKEFIDRVDSIVFGVGLPGIVMTVVIATTITTAWKLRQVVTWRAEISTSSQLSSREVALTKMLIGTSILFIVCVFPFALTRFSWLMFPEMNTGRRNQNFYLTTFWMNKLLSYVNASFNIFVYYGMGSRYREMFWELFSKKSNAVKGK